MSCPVCSRYGITEGHAEQMARAVQRGKQRGMAVTASVRAPEHAPGLERSEASGSEEPATSGGS
jgi:hypothetical protein